MTDDEIAKIKEERDRYNALPIEVILKTNILNWIVARIILTIRLQRNTD
jgi:hypothetical protein